MWVLVVFWKLIFYSLNQILSTDTAVVYRNEEHIGNALKKLLPKYNLKREDIFITSKLSKLDYEKKTIEFINSLLST